MEVESWPEATFAICCACGNRRQIVDRGVLESVRVADCGVLEDVARGTSVVVGASGWGDIEVVVALDPENVVGEVVDR